MIRLEKLVVFLTIDLPKISLHLDFFEQLIDLLLNKYFFIGIIRERLLGYIKYKKVNYIKLNQVITTNH